MGVSYDRDGRDLGDPRMNLATVYAYGAACLVGGFALGVIWSER